MKPENKISTPAKIEEVINSVDQESSENVKNRLIFLINELINKDFASLVQLLYKIDIDEKKLKQLLKDEPETNAASTIADLIIKRQIQKIATRKQFDKGQKPAAEDSW